MLIKGTRKLSIRKCCKTVFGNTTEVFHNCPLGISAVFPLRGLAKYYELTALCNLSVFSKPVKYLVKSSRRKTVFKLHVCAFSQVKQSSGGVLQKNVFLEILQNSPEYACARVSFLIKLQAWGLQFYWKRDSGTGVFLWISRNF